MKGMNSARVDLNQVMGWPQAKFDDSQGVIICSVPFGSNPVYEILRQTV
jgi:hypothetical protein